MQAFRFTEGYQPQSGPRAGSLTLTLLVGGAIVSAMFFISPHFVRIDDPAMKIRSIPLDPVPPPEKTPPKTVPKVQPRQQTQVYVPPIEPLFRIDPPPQVDFTETPPPPTGDGGTGTVPAKLAPARPPVLTGAELDQRYAANFQPAYPADELREGREGRVTVRVRIGTDGRVLQVEKVSAPSDSFFEATRRRALEKWRFTPATRDGVPYETWKVVGVTFVLNQ